MHTRQRGVTFIELLVTIAIISILIALLLPALGSTRRSVDYTTCLYNVRMFATAFSNYHQDNDGYLVHNNWGPSSGGWLYAKRRGGGWTAPSGSMSIEERQEMVRTGLLYPYVERNDDLYRCPRDQGPFDVPEWPVRAMSSYQMNGAVTGYANEKFSIEMFRTDAVFLWETDADTDRVRGGFWNDGANRPDEGIAIRHEDGAPVGKMDGSGERIGYDEFYDLVFPDGAARNQPNALWCAPDTTNGH